MFLLLELVVCDNVSGKLKHLGSSLFESFLSLQRDQISDINIYLELHLLIIFCMLQDLGSLHLYFSLSLLEYLLRRGWVLRFSGLGSSL